MLGNANLRAGAFLSFVLGGAGLGSRRRSLGLSESLGSGGRVDVLGALGHLRQDSDNVGADLGEAALDEKPSNLRAAPEAELAQTEAPDQRRPPGEDAKLAIVHGQGDEVSGLVENGALGRHDDTLEGMAVGHGV